MDVLKMILSIVLIIDCIACVIVVLMQESKQNGLGTISGAASTDTYWGKNKARSQEGRMKMFTVIAAVVFFIISIVLNLSVFN